VIAYWLWSLRAGPSTPARTGQALGKSAQCRIWLPVSSSRRCSLTGGRAKINGAMFSSSRFRWNDSAGKLRFPAPKLHFIVFIDHSFV
jgi:hypothetical protein